jgi:lipid-binding SYLF domain-containing protein
MRLIAPFVLTALLLATTAPALAGPREDLTLERATVVLQETAGMEKEIVPDWLLERAEGIAVLPDVIKFGFGFGGRYGEGVLVVRQRDGRWSNPVFIKLIGGSFGWQIGGQSTDLVLVFTTRKSVEGISDGKLTLGADASVAAGPFGRAASAATTIDLAAEVYSYSRNRGLFAGLALDGTQLVIHDKANANFYRKPDVVASDITAADSPAPPASADPLLAEVRRITAPKAKPAAGAAPPTGAAPQATAAPPAPPAGDAQTFPVEDRNPGKPPN